LDAETEREAPQAWLGAMYVDVARYVRKCIARKHDIDHVDRRHQVRYTRQEICVRCCRPNALVDSLAE